MNLDDVAALLMEDNYLKPGYSNRYKLPSGLRYSRDTRHKILSQLLKDFPKAAMDLNARQRMAINILYGLQIGNYPARTPEGLFEGGRELNITRARLQQLEIRAFKLLMHYYIRERNLLTV